MVNDTHTRRRRLEAQNLPFQRIRRTLTFLLYTLDCLRDNGTGPISEYVVNEKMVDGRYLNLIMLISLFFSFSCTFFLRSVFVPGYPSAFYCMLNTHYRIVLHFMTLLQSLK